MLSDCVRAGNEADALSAALLALPALSGAMAVAVLRRQEDGSLDLPTSWRDDGLEWSTQHDLPGHAGTLVLAWRDEPKDNDALELALVVLGAVLARHQAQGAYDDLVARVDNAQQLADMGDYDWHIVSNTNRWSDQLYRIYGHEPRSFNPTYERFLDMVHPEDRERIAAIHQDAYRTGQPYQMIERIVRPDGEVRHLASNGQVFMDESGTPLRFRGTCIDITEQVHAEQEREQLIMHTVEDRLRRRQALELNDSVVQGLATASYALDLGEIEQAASHLSRTLSAARLMMDDLIRPASGGSFAPGDLVRSAPASLPPECPAPSDPGPSDPGPSDVDAFR